MCRTFLPWVMVLGGAACACAPSGEGGGCTDEDGDGFGRAGSTGCVFAGVDCADGDPFVNPGAVERCGNGVDDDCRDGDAICGADGDADLAGEAEADLDVDAEPDSAGEEGSPDEGAADRVDAAEAHDEADVDEAVRDEAAAEDAAREETPAEDAPVDVDAGPCCDDDHDRYGEGPGCLGPDCDDEDDSVTTACDVLFEDWLERDETLSYDEGGVHFEILAGEAGDCSATVRGFTFTINGSLVVICQCRGESYEGGYAVTLLDVFDGTTADGGIFQAAQIRITRHE